MTETLRDICKQLRLAHVPDVFEEIPFTSAESYIRGVLLAELERREDTKWQKLVKLAAFPQLKTINGYDFTTVNFPSSEVEQSIRNLTFIEEKQNILMLGKVGTGKTHLATALGVEACRNGIEVRFFRVSDLASILHERHTAGTLTRFLKEIHRCELLILDEVGYVPFHQTSSELLFQLISGCYERNSVVVTSNLEFGQWNTIFGDTRLTAALVDRLVHHAHILAFTGESYRLRNALSQVKGGN